MLAASITATVLAIGPAPAARPVSTRSAGRPFGLAGDLAGFTDQSSADQSSADRGSAGQAAADQEADAQASDVEETVRHLHGGIERSQAAHSAAVARRTMAALHKAMLLAAQRREAAEHVAAQRTAARQPAAPTSTAPATPAGSPRQIAMGMLAGYGWSASEFGCLDSLWERESGWNPDAENPYSGAYGIPQALPGSKMASAGADWATDAATQIRWGLGYIKAVYGSPCGAWGHETADGWY